MLDLVPPRLGAELSSGHPRVPSWADVQCCVFGSQCSISACASEHKAGHCTGALLNNTVTALGMALGGSVPAGASQMWLLQQTGPPQSSLERGSTGRQEA